jgi:F0F1-type ATP synthase delta subunit
MEEWAQAMAQTEAEAAMLSYTNRFAEALLEYADENGLELVYRQALQWATQIGRARRRRGKPGSRVDGKPGSWAGGKPGSWDDGKPGGRVDSKPSGRVDGKPGSRVDGKPGAMCATKPNGSDADAELDIQADPPLGPFLFQVPREQREAVIDRFINIARDRLNLVQAEVFSAVQLTPSQQQMIEIRLIRMFKKQIELTAIVDPALIGGLRIVVGGVVIDDSIKRKLSDMKDSMYKGGFQLR